jgi:hypothetical protein
MTLRSAEWTIDGVCLPRPGASSGVLRFRLKPGLGRLFPRLALFRRQLSDEIIEPQVGDAAFLGNKMPFDGFHRLGLDAKSGGQDPRQAVLGDGTAPARRFAEQCDRRLFVLLRSSAVEQRDGIFDLGLKVIGKRGFGEQLGGFRQVLGDPTALFVKGC